MPSKKGHLNLNFELPPTSLSKHTNLSRRKSLKHRKRITKTSSTDYLEDDTPKAFARLMSSGTKRKRGGEEDIGGPKEKKTSQGNPNKQPLPSTQKKLEQQRKPSLQILPGESLRAFNRRVDASMPIPLKGPKTSKTDPIDHLPNSKSKLKQPTSIPAEDPEEEDYSDYLTDSSTYSLDSHGDPRPKTFRPRAPRPRQKRTPGRKKKPKPRGPSPDPFAILLEKRGKPKFGETAEAPPELRVKPKEILRAKRKVGVGVDVGGIPKAVGSIARREILAEERRGVVERYREMMEGRRAVGGA
ncbi:hypothetical protein BGX38DRAFT_1143486 [Terfezia claveryi]|nr:hypothetical protein BGX38DRAFT_1143486 [Terfezia claveryi]